MSKRTYEEYIKNGCHPVGYNEPCQSYYFGQVSVDLLLDQIDQLKQQLAEKDKKLLEFKRDRLYFELLLTRLQWLHKKADDYRQEKERFGIADMSLSSVWDVLELKKNDLCEYEEMCALQEGIECVANSKLLGDIEHDLQVKTTRSEDEIFKDIDKIDQQIKELKGEKDAEG